MRRSAIFIILLCLSGTPALGIVCSVLCASEARQKATGSCHHGDVSGGPAARIAAGQSCEHSVGLAPFVLDAGRAAAFAPSALPRPAALQVCAPVLTAMHRLAPPGGRRPSDPRLASALRI